MPHTSLATPTGFEPASAFTASWSRSIRFSAGFRALGRAVIPSCPCSSLCVRWQLSRIQPDTSGAVPRSPAGSSSWPRKLTQIKQVQIRPALIANVAAVFVEPPRPSAGLARSSDRCSGLRDTCIDRFRGPAIYRIYRSVSGRRITCPACHLARLTDPSIGITRCWPFTTRFCTPGIHQLTV
jgi:hypothetical protein